MSKSTTSRLRAGPGMHALALATVVLTIVLISTGSSVRVTGSGMGCLDDWPLCHGSILPPLEFTAILEWLHRFTTSIVTFPILALAYLAWRRYRHDRAVLLPALLAVFFLGVQVILGAVVVWLTLPPALVGIHMANSMLVLGALSAVWPAVSRAARGTDVEDLPAPLARYTYFTAMATYSQIVLGSVMVHIGASGACGGFPLCNGELLPAGTLAQVHMAHRALGIVAALGAMAMWWQALRTAPGTPARRRVPLLAAVTLLFVVQIALGAGNVLLGFPQVVNVLHLAAAATLWAALVALSMDMALASRPAPVPAAPEKAPA